MHELSLTPLEKREKRVPVFKPRLFFSVGFGGPARRPCWDFCGLEEVSCAGFGRNETVAGMGESGDGGQQEARPMAARWHLYGMPSYSFAGSNTNKRPFVRGLSL